MRYINLPENIATKVFVLDSGALAETPAVLKNHFSGAKPLIVADTNTYAAAGGDLYDLLLQNNMQPYEPVILPGTPKPHPDYALAQLLSEGFPADCVPVAVGSGVINDLVKCAADLKKLRYCCVATAASVDGYTASGGAMSVENQKKTVPCPPPYALIADSNILQTAPPEMMASGYADLMSKVTGGADWIIADMLGIEKIDPACWSIVQDDLRDNLSDVHDLEKLFLGLAATGYAMQMYKDSRPASGAEHLCSHVWEMEHLTVNGEEVSHGFKVGIGLLAIAQLHEFVINTPIEQARSMARSALNESQRAAEIDQLLIKGCYGNAIQPLAMEKTPFGAELLLRRNKIFAIWNDLQKRLAQQLIPSATLRAMLKKAGAPTRFEAIGLEAEQYFHGIKTAQLIRKRYTVLDMLYEAGLLDEALTQLVNE
ncbi:MAG: sn-glycerol-1-phosphate dehydrogenase [Lentisphaerae bacterium]|nr:sn-glycerol-1-phosphate dehydrogenase [Lentisphaerota bacterium]